MHATLTSKTGYLSHSTPNNQSLELFFWGQYYAVRVLGLALYLGKTPGNRGTRHAPRSLVERMGIVSMNNPSTVIATSTDVTVLNTNGILHTMSTNKGVDPLVFHPPKLHETPSSVEQVSGGSDRHKHLYTAWCGLYSSFTCIVSVAAVYLFCCSVALVFHTTLVISFFCSFLSSVRSPSLSLLLCDIMCHSLPVYARALCGCLVSV